MIDLTTVLGDAAAVVDPKGENEDVSVLCGLVAWAVEHPGEYEGWDAETSRRVRVPSLPSLELPVDAHRVVRDDPWSP
jgi:hypothetical protein